MLLSGLLGSPTFFLTSRRLQALEMESLGLLKGTEAVPEDSETFDATLGIQQSQDGGPEELPDHGMEQIWTPLGPQMAPIHSTKKTVESEVLRLHRKTQDLSLQLVQLEEDSGDTAPVELSLRAAERALQRLLESQKRALQVQQQLHQLARESASLSRDGRLGLDPALPAGSSRLPVPDSHQSESGGGPQRFTEARGGFGGLMRDGLHRAQADPKGRLLGSNVGPQHSNTLLDESSSIALLPAQPEVSAQSGAQLPARATARQLPWQPRESHETHPGELGTG